MSRENVELVGDALAAFSDPERLSEFFSSDSVWDMSTFAGWPEQAEFRGLDEFFEFRDAWTAPYAEWTYEVERILDAGGNQVVATFYQRGKLHGSDSWSDLRYAIVYTIEAGLIERSQVYASVEQALEAVGLSE
jgi:ketosteroid isomerase-like protein